MMSKNSQDGAMDNPQERSLFKIGYLLGIIDGEGHLGFRRQWQKNGSLQISPVLQIVNCNKKLIDRTAEYMKDLELPVYVAARKSYHENDRPTWVILLKGCKRLSKVVNVLLQYSFSKFAQAKLIQEYINYRHLRLRYSKVDLEYFNKMTILNKKGAKSSETIRLTLRREDIVRSHMKV